MIRILKFTFLPNYSALSLFIKQSKKSEAACYVFFLIFNEIIRLKAARRLVYQSVIFTNVLFKFETGKANTSTVADSCGCHHGACYHDLSKTQRCECDEGWQGNTFFFFLFFLIEHIKSITSTTAMRQSFIVFYGMALQHHSTELILLHLIYEGVQV